MGKTELSFEVPWPETFLGQQFADNDLVDDLIRMTKDGRYLEVYMKLDEMGVEGRKEDLINALRAYGRLKSYSETPSWLIRKILNIVWEEFELELDDDEEFDLEQKIRGLIESDMSLFSSAQEVKFEAFKKLIADIREYMTHMKIESASHHTREKVSNVVNGIGNIIKQL